MRPHDGVPAPPTASALAAPLSASTTGTSAAGLLHRGMPTAPASLPNCSAYNAGNGASLHSSGTSSPPLLNPAYPPAPLTQNLTAPLPWRPGCLSPPLHPHPQSAAATHAAAPAKASALSGVPVTHSMCCAPAAGLARVCSNPDVASADGSAPTHDGHALHSAPPGGMMSLKQSSSRVLSGNVSASMVGTIEGGEGSQGAEESAQSRSVYVDEPNGNFLSSRAVPPPRSPYHTYVFRHADTRIP